jgi:hypothetical protein
MRNPQPRESHPEKIASQIGEIENLAHDQPEKFEPSKRSNTELMEQKKESYYPKTAEEGSRNYEEFLRFTQPNWTERQIRITVDDHRKMIGLPPLAEANLTQKMRDWIEITKGEFQTRDVFEELNIQKEQKAQVSKILTRLVSEGLIERTGRRTGCFRRIEKDLARMDIFENHTKLVNITLPFGIDEMVKIMPGNVIVVAGAKDSGKTAFLLNIVADNLGKFEIHYFNSEMGAGELRARLELFDDIPFEEWRAVNFFERDENFADVIVPGEGNLNVIDFLEIYEDFWIVKKRIAEIWRKLQGAVAIIALQKPQGRDFAFGGEGSIEKARLALALEKGKLKIVSGKNWKTKENPRDKVMKFKLAGGCKFVQTDDWSLE